MRSVLSFSPNMPDGGRLKCLQGTPRSTPGTHTLSLNQRQSCHPSCAAALLEREPPNILHACFCNDRDQPLSLGRAAEGSVNKPAGSQVCIIAREDEECPRIRFLNTGCLHPQAAPQEPTAFLRGQRAQPDLVPDSTALKRPVSRSHTPAKQVTSQGMSLRERGPHQQ